MKKIVAVLLVLMMALGMVACTSDKDVRGTKTTVSMGETEGSKYESKFIGIGFNLPSGWTFYTDEQIREMNNITGDMMGDKYAEQIKKADIIYDMMAIQTTTGNSVNINLEKASALGATITSEETYVKNGMSSVKQALESMGATNVTAKQTKVKLAGESLHAIELSMKINGVALYEKVICKKVGNYFACITVGTTGSDQTESVISQFYSLKK